MSEEWRLLLTEWCLAWDQARDSKLSSEQVKDLSYSAMLFHIRLAPHDATGSQMTACWDETQEGSSTHHVSFVPLGL